MAGLQCVGRPDFIESMNNIDGIMYESTMSTGGSNLLLFNEQDATCISTPELYKIQTIDFKTELIS